VPTAKSDVSVSGEACRLLFDAVHGADIDSTTRCPKFLSKKPDHAVGATMPFSKYNGDFNADLMESMRAAFYRVCDVLELSCDREDPLTEVVVTKIVELAKAGERDPEILCSKVLADLGTPASSPSMTSVAAE
jgi:hypothetical protein